MNKETRQFFRGILLILLGIIALGTAIISTEHMIQRIIVGLCGAFIAFVGFENFFKSLNNPK